MLLGFVPTAYLTTSSAARSLSGIFSSVTSLVCLNEDLSSGGFENLDQIGNRLRSLHLGLLGTVPLQLRGNAWRDVVVRICAQPPKMAVFTVSVTAEPFIVWVTSGEAEV
jgi:hypothetical protein